MKRIIGIQHRVKASAKGEARPTVVTIALEGDLSQSVQIKLPDEQSELDFALGRYPLKMRAVTAEDDISNIPAHQLTVKEISEDEVALHPAAHVQKIGRKHFVVTKIPDVVEGPKQDDSVVMTLGGSGDNFAYALSQAGESSGVAVLRTPPSALKAYRDETGEKDKESDSSLLVKLFGVKPEAFYQVKAKDRDLIVVRESFRARMEAMKARIGCEQRLGSLAIGRVFTSPGGLYAQGNVEKAFDELKANDAVYLALVSEESKRNKDLAKALEKIPVYTQVFANVEGVGPSIAAKIIACIGDIKQFPTVAKF